MWLLGCSLTQEVSIALLMPGSTANWNGLLRVGGYVVARGERGLFHIDCNCQLKIPKDVTTETNVNANYIHCNYYSVGRFNYNCRSSSSSRTGQGNNKLREHVWNLIITNRINTRPIAHMLMNQLIREASSIYALTLIIYNNLLVWIDTRFRVNVLIVRIGKPNTLNN